MSTRDFSKQRSSQYYKWLADHINKEKRGIMLDEGDGYSTISTPIKVTPILKDNNVEKRLVADDVEALETLESSSSKRFCIII